MGRKIVWLLSLVLIGCTTLPEGPYVAYPGVAPANSTIIATAEYQNYSIVILDKAPYEPTQETGTFVTATPSFQKCEVRAGLNVKFYSRPNGTALGLLEVGQTYFPLEVDANFWIRLDVGWVILSDQFPLFDNEACMDMVPPPLIMTDTPFPTLTPIQVLYVCPRLDSVNVRALATTSSRILGVLSSGQRATVKTIYDFWYQIEYKGLTGYTHKDYSILCQTGILQ